MFTSTVCAASTQDWVNPTDGSVAQSVGFVNIIPKFRLEQQYFLDCGDIIP